MIIFTAIKVGRGRNKPTKFKKCSECGQECVDHRVDYKEPVKKSVCIVCLVRAYEYKKQKESRWYNKIISFCIPSKPSPVESCQKIDQVKPIVQPYKTTGDNNFEETLEKAA